MRERIALMAEARAQLHRERGDPSVTPHLRAFATDVRAGFDEDLEAHDRVHTHEEDGGLYVLLGTCSAKDDATGEWVDSVCYRALGGPRAAVLCVTSQQRWDDRFSEVRDDA